MLTTRGVTRLSRRAVNVRKSANANFSSSSLTPALARGVAGLPSLTSAKAQSQVNVRGRVGVNAGMLFLYFLVSLWMDGL